MSNTDLFDIAEELITGKKYSEAVSELEKVTAEHLTYEETRALTSLFARIPEEYRAASAPHCLQELELAAMSGNQSSVEKWYGRMIALREKYKDGTQARTVLEDYICMANIVRPGSDNARLLLMMAVLYHEGAGTKAHAVLSPTARMPSVLRGRKDLSDWSQTYGAVTSILSPIISALFGTAGNGLTDCFRAEVLLERGNLSAAADAIAGALSASDPDIYFAGHAILTRIKSRQPGGQSPDTVLDSIGTMIEERGAYWLVPNYNALRAQFSLLSDGKYAREWFETDAPDELSGIAPCDYFRAMTKAKLYLAFGRTNDALMLAQMLIALVASSDSRPLNTADCLAMEAVACHLGGNDDEAAEKLEKALELTEIYGYVNLYTAYGAPMAELLASYIQRCPDGGSRRYAEKILAATEVYAKLYPALLSDEPAAPEQPAELPHEERAGEPDAQPAEEKSAEPDAQPTEEKAAKAPEKKPKPKKKK